MGERKVLNKYIPADFDPRLVPRGTKSKDDLVPVRMMLPFSIQCTTCSSFMYRGKKFNSKKEPVKGPKGKYLGIQRYRFYIKCSVCSRPITFTTDPQNADYEMETGATRNYEVHKDRDKTNELIAIEKMESEKSDPMKALENRVIDSQREMADLDNLDEIKAMNLRHAKMMSSSSSSISAGGGKNGGGGCSGDIPGTGGVVGGFQTVDAVLNAREIGLKNGSSKVEDNDEADEELNEYGITEKEEALVKSLKFGCGGGGGETTPRTFERIHRLDEEDENAIDKRRQRDLERIEKSMLPSTEDDSQKPEKRKNETTSSTKIVPIIKAKRKRRAAAEAVVQNNTAGTTTTTISSSSITVPPQNEKGINANLSGRQQEDIHLSGKKKKTALEEDDSENNNDDDGHDDNDNDNDNGDGQGVGLSLGGLLGVYGSDSESD